ncbi:MAG: hypothetical protein ACFFCI_06895 [Promethearchaeota archaeon]
MSSKNRKPVENVMLESYGDFMVFEVKDTGERVKLNLTEDAFCQDNGEKVLHPLQVAIIVKEELRRIYIWKGISSSIRKKFIASRIASEIQRDIINSSYFHRCKIISVDQGDEPAEFLNAFGFKKVLITNDDKIEENANESSIYENKPEKINYQLENGDINNKIIQSNKIGTKIIPSYEVLKEKQHTRKILENILQKKVPNNFTRKNILIGNNLLYGIIKKKTKIFNESIEEEEWELILGFPLDIIDLEGHKLRIHYNKSLQQIQAIEILEEIIPSKKHEQNKEGRNLTNWTVKQLRQFCRENNIKVPSNYRKADIIRLVLESNKFCK